MGEISERPTFRPGHMHDAESISYQLNRLDAILGQILDHIGVRRGTGSPEGVVAARIGSAYLRQDGGVGTTLYIKEQDDGENTGWAAK